jgi:hypothetical protein
MGVEVAIAPLLTVFSIVLCLVRKPKHYRLTTTILMKLILQLEKL